MSCKKLFDKFDAVGLKSELMLGELYIVKTVVSSSNVNQDTFAKKEESFKGFVYVKRFLFH